MSPEGGPKSRTGAKGKFAQFLGDLLALLDTALGASAVSEGEAQKAEPTPREALRGRFVGLYETLLTASDVNPVLLVYGERKVKEGDARTLQPTGKQGGGGTQDQGPEKG